MPQVCTRASAPGEVGKSLAAEASRTRACTPLSSSMTNRIEYIGTQAERGTRKGKGLSEGESEMR
jgi:hypothetical protein